jgi:hypothetical protein
MLGIETADSVDRVHDGSSQGSDADGESTGNNSILDVD